MKNKGKRYPTINKFWLYLISFLVPTTLMTMYFISRHMAPFGSSSLLTIDLGQQYIDFFAYFRHAILHDPSSLIYSFSNGLGGEMIGTWAYYLFSPLNWILLFFPGTTLTSGIFLMTVVKYGLAGLSFFWLMQRTVRPRFWLSLTFSTAYAMMGWTVANQLNLMWLDAVILLPIIFYGLTELIDKGKWRLYVAWLTAMLIINYYMAYMICFFLVLSFIWLVADRFTDWKTMKQQLLRFIVRSTISGLLASTILLPTVWSLAQSKAQYTLTSYKWDFEYFPPAMFIKFFMGVFNFNQMFAGYPNLFVGSIVVIGSFLFFFNKNFSVRSRIVAGIITLFYFLSLSFRPLILLWHAGQFPTGYTFRFSFVVCFWLFWLAAQTISEEFKPTKWGIISFSVVTLITCLYIGVNLKEFSALKPLHFIMGMVFVVVLAVLLLLPIRWKSKFVVVCVISTLEIFLNAALSLNEIGYLQVKDYSQYTKELQSLVSRVQRNDSSFYRIGKTFLRDNDDPYQANFNSGAVSSSALTKDTATFMGRLGNPDGSIFVEYSNGTLISDALLDMKYYFQPNQSIGIESYQTKLPVSSNRFDLSEYKEVHRDKQAITYRNDLALPLGYLASPDVISLKAIDSNPAEFQADWLSALTGQASSKTVFTNQKFDHTEFTNIYPVKKLNGSMLKKIDKRKESTGVVTTTFTPKPNSVYYITFGPDTNFKAARFIVNGTEINEKRAYRNPILISASGKDSNETQTLQIQLNRKSMKLQDFKLYRLDLDKYRSTMKELKKHPWNLTKHTSRYLSGTITSPRRGDVLNTSIPYSQGWHVKLNGHSVKTYKTVDMFTAVKLDKGANKVTFSYWPPYLNVGIILSSVTLVGLSIEEYLRKRQD